MTKRSLRKSERGNVFFTLFGAVAIVGVLGAAIMATMRGPLTTMVNVNHKTQAEADMSIASKLVLLEAVDSLANGGDCDSDNFVEPLEYKIGAPAPTGGGHIPDSIGSVKVDPWGTPYGYCSWDAGTVIDNAACDDDTSTSYERLDGKGDSTEDYMVMAIVSAGPDQTFQTTCTGGATPDVTKTAGSDDFYTTFTYATAAAATDGLWKLKSGDPATAEIGKNIAAQGATFTGGVDLTGPSAQLQLGAASMLLPTEADLIVCNAANVNLLRVNTSDDPDTLQICDDASDTGAGAFSWQNVAAGAAGLSLWKNDGPGGPGEIYYSTDNVGIGLNNPTQPLDVVGNVHLSNNLMLDSAKSVIWNGTGANILENTGNLEISAVSGGEIDVKTTGIDLLGNTVIRGTTADDTTKALEIFNSTPTSLLLVQNDGDVGIGIANPDDRLDISGSVDISLDYKLDDITFLTDNGAVDSVLLGKAAGSVLSTGVSNTIVGSTSATALTTGTYNTMLGMGAGTTLATGKNNILIGAHDVTAINVPAAGTSNYLNIGNLIYGDLTNKRVGIGTDTLTDALEVTGTIDASVDVNADGDVLAGDDVIATGDVTGTDVSASSQVIVGGDQLGPAAVCTGAQKLQWTNGAGWSCITDLNDGSGGTPDDLDNVLTTGNNAATLTAINFGGIAIGSSVLSTGGSQNLVLDVTGAAGADYFCDASGNNCFTAGSVAGGGNPKLSAIVAADANNTINNAAWNQAWNWALTGAETGFAFGENVASTGGASDQYILSASTLAASTAIPLFINNLGNGRSFQVNDVAADTSPFVIDNAGNVGVGLTAPGQKLSVNGRIETQGGMLFNEGASWSDNLIYVGSTSAGAVNASFGFLVGGVGSSNSNDGPYFLARGNTFSALANQRGNQLFVAGNPAAPGPLEGSIQFWTGAEVNRMTITNAGKIGIGDSSPDDGSGSGGQALLLDIEGPAGATYYCDEAGLNCFTAASVSGTGLWERNGTVIRTRNPAVYTTDDFVFGSPQLADDADPNHDARMFFDKSKGAFRAGNVDGAQWDDANVGDYSTAMGHLTTASGYQSTALGYNTVASGDTSTALGYQTTASNNQSTAMGIYTTASGSRSTAIGYGTTASGIASTAIGRDVVAGDGTAFSGFGDGSIAVGLIDDAVTITSNPVVTGIQSFGIFMGDQDAVNVSANNIMALLGGRLVIDPDTTSATNTNVSTGAQQLEIDVEGDIGAINYCDQNGNNCFTASGILTSVTPRLSSLLAANADNSINNAAHNQVWNWQLTGAESAFTFGENAASTGGASDQYIVTASTLAASTAIPLYINNLGAGRSFQVNDAAADTTPFVIDASGNVGIGKTAPGYPLDVFGQTTAIYAKGGNGAGSGTTTSIYAYTDADSGTSYGLNIYSYNDSGTSYGIYNTSESVGGTAIGIYTNIINTGGTSYAAILNGGNVGLGTTAPSYLLSLDGDTTAQTIGMERETTAATAGRNLTILAGGGDAGSTNVAGGSLALSSGIATGNGASSILFQTVLANQGTGSTDRTPATSMTLASNSLTLPTAASTAEPGQAGMQAAANGMIYYNTTTGKFRGYQNGAWSDIITASAVTAIDDLTDAYADYVTSHNLIMGRTAAAALTAGAQFNTYVGEGAATGVSTAATDSNTAVGYQALKVLTSGAANTAIGANSLVSNTIGGSNIAIGTSALLTNTSGSSNIGIGNNIGIDFLNITGAGNIVIGDSAYTDTSASTLGNASGSNNTILGTGAVGLDVNGTGLNPAGSNNVVIGASSGTDMFGSNNIIVGAGITVPVFNASNQLNIGGTIFGDLANDRVRIGGSGAVGAFNDLELAGTLALKVSAGTTAQRPGTGSNGMLRYNSTNNKFEGYQNGSWQDILTSGGGSTYIDNLADAETDYVTDHNMFLGVERLPSVGGQYNLGLGETALDSVTTGDNNIAIGYAVLTAVTTQINNIGIGKNVLSSGTNTGNYNIGIGFESLKANTSGTNNVAIGDDSMFANTTGGNNVALGGNSLANNTTGTNNTGLGESALSSNKAKQESTAIGYRSMYYADDTTTGAVTYNTAVGAYALQGSATASANTGTSNTAIGHSAIQNITTGTGNTAVGQLALRSTNSGSWNTAIGNAALQTNANGVENVAVGSAALQANASGGRNVALGDNSLYQNLSGGYNIAIGDQAGETTTTGSYNILIGPSVVASAAGASNELNIGDTIYGDLASDNVRIGGTGAVSAFSNLEINGTLALKLPSGTDAQRPGTPAGGMFRYNTTATPKDVIEYYDAESAAWVQVPTSVAGGAVLSGITAATTTNTIASGDHAQNWNWALTTATKDAFTFGETTAATNGAGAQSILKASTLATSTAMPLWVVNEGNALSLRVDDVAADTSPVIIDASGNVAIGAATARALLDVNGDDFIVSGTYTGTASVPATGTGTRMFFDTQKSAFRAGSVSGAEWDNASIGDYSVAMGTDVTASGTGSVAIGTITTASGFSSLAMGLETTASGNFSTAMGDDSIASGNYGVAIGNDPIASGVASIAMGSQVTAGNGVAGSGLGDGSFAIGLKDPTIVTTTSPQVRGDESLVIFMGDQDGLVQTGNNTMALFGGKMIIDSAVPATYMAAPTYNLSFSGNTAAQTIGVERETTAATAGRDLTINAGGAVSAGTNLAGGSLVLKSGTATGSGVSAISFQVAGTTAAGALNGAGTADGAPVERMALKGDGDFIVNGGASGYTGTASVPSTGAGTRMFFDVQKAAFRAGSVNGIQWNNAAIGNYSTAFGANNTASGSSSFAIGSGTSATGQDSVAMGNSTISNNSYSTAMGWLTNSTGLASTTMGSGTNASGDNSIAAGQSTLATGSNSMAIGYSTTAAGDYSLSAGNKVNITSAGDGSVGFGLTTTIPATAPQISGAQSFGVFMGDHSAVNFAAANTVGFFGGNMVIDPATPATQLSARGVIDVGAATTSIVLPRGTDAQRPGTPVGGMFRYNTDATPKDVIEYYDAESAAWVQVPTSVAGGAVLSGITAATATNTIDNAAYAQVWNWSGMTGATTDGFTFGETTSAAINGVGSQSILKATNMAASTAIPLLVNNASNNAVSFKVTDDGTDTDTSPFIINASGQVGIGTESPDANAEMHIVNQTAGQVSDLVIGNPNVTGNNSSDGVLKLYGESGGVVSSGTIIQGSTNMFITVPGQVQFQSDALMDGGTSLYFMDVGYTKTVEMLHDGTNFTVTNTNGDINFPSDNINIGTATGTTGAALKIGTTNSIMLPSGTDAQRPGTPAGGMFRYNTTATPNDVIEYYDAETAGWVQVPTAVAGGAVLSGITAATATNTINSGTFAQEWQWNTLAGNTAFKLSSSSTAAAGNAQRMFEVALSGANATATQTTVSGYFTNTHTGTASTNIGLYASASGGTNNYAALFPAGRVGIGTTAPEQALHVEGAIMVTNGFGKGYFVGNSNYVGIGNESSAGNTPQITIVQGTGNVGIGVTLPSLASYLLSLDGDTADQTIGMERETTAATAGRNLTILAGGAVSAGTNIAGGTLNLTGGTATGTGTSAISFQVAGTTATGILNGTGTTDRTPVERMSLKGDGDFIVNGGQFGFTGTASVPVSGAGTRMFFDVQKAAFRAGYNSSTFWDNANIGNYSVAFGYNTRAIGAQSTALGISTIASGASSTAMGTSTIASGISSTAMGYAVTSGNGTAGSGFGDGSIAMGLIDDAVGITTASQVHGNQSLGIFMGDQDGLVMSASNTMGLFGGNMVIDPAVPATQLTARGVIDVGAATTSIVLPRGTDAQRPGTPVGGMFRYNTTATPKDVIEYYDAESAAWVQVPTSVAGGAVLSGITAATATNTINSGTHAQEWQWNTLAGNTGLKLSSTSTAAASNAQKVFEIALSGANATSTQTTYGSYITNTHTGTASTNVGLYASASGGTNNYAAIFDAGNVGIGTTTPLNALQINGNLSIETNSPADSRIGFNSYYNGSVDVRIAGNSASQIWNDSASNDFFIRTAPWAAAGSTITWNDAIIVDGTTGNVGLGSYATTYKLSIDGDTAAQTIGMERETTNATAGRNLTILAGGGDLGSTNVNGGDLILSSGTATGSGNSLVKILATQSTGGGTTDRAPSEAARFFSISGGGAGGMGLPSNGAVMFNGYLKSGSDSYIDADSAFEIWHDRGNDLLKIDGEVSGAADGSISFQSGIRMDVNGSVAINSAQNTLAAKFVVAPPASEAVAGAATITANACGTVKQITSVGNVTTNTTDTFTASTASYAGCCMDVVNVDTADTITLDQNAKFLTGDGSDIALAPNKAVRVCSNGTNWYQGAAVSSVASSGSSIDGLSDAETDYVTDFNMFLGVERLPSVGGQYNIGLGQTAGDSITTGDNNIAIGYDALTAINDDLNNVAIGNNALNGMSVGDYNIAIGYMAMDNAGAGATYNNVALGYNTLGTTTGDNNTAIGHLSQQRDAGGNNASLGTYSLRYFAGASGNTAVGYSALLGVDGSSTGGSNTALGFQAGDSITTGASNILIGYDVDTPAATTSNHLNIGGTIFGDVSTDNVRIGGTGAVSAFSNLEVNGTLALKLPGGTDAQRPGTPAGGMFRYNTTATPKDVIEYYDAESAAWVQVPTSVAGGAVLSGITAATATNTINSGTYAQEWQWNTLAGNTAFKLSASSTAAAANAQKVFEIALSGANATSTQTTYGAYLANTHTGTDSTNVGLYASASGGTNNYAAIFGAGNVGIGTTTPTAILQAVDGANTFSFFKGNANATPYVLASTTGQTAVGIMGGTDASGVTFDNSRPFVIGVDSKANLDAGTSDGGTPLMVITTTGNVGIDMGANLTPSYNLSFDGDTAAQTIGMERETTNTTAGRNLTILAGGGDAGSTNVAGGDLVLSSGISTGTGASKILFNVATGGLTGTTDRTPAEVMRLTSTGLGIFNNTPSVALDVTGSIEFTGTIHDVSDIRLKTDITPLKPADVLNRLAQVNTYSFRMKDDPAHQIEFGVMAQELEKLFPELVKTANDDMGTKSVNYMGLIAPMIEAMKEQQTQIETLKAERTEIHADLDELRADIRGLKTHTGYGIGKAAIGLWMLAGMAGTILLLFVSGALFKNRQRKPE